MLQPRGIDFRAQRMDERWCKSCLDMRNDGSTDRTEKRQCDSAQEEGVTLGPQGGEGPHCLGRLEAVRQAARKAPGHVRGAISAWAAFPLHFPRYAMRVCSNSNWAEFIEWNAILWITLCASTDLPWCFSVRVKYKSSIVKMRRRPHPTPCRVQVLPAPPHRPLASCLLLVPTR